MNAPGPAFDPRPARMTIRSRPRRTATSAYASTASPSVCEKDNPAPGRSSSSTRAVRSDFHSGSVNAPASRARSPGPVAGQREPSVEQRFEAEHVLPFGLVAPASRILGPVEVEGIESNVEGIHSERPSMNDVAPSREQEVFRSSGVLDMEFVHIEAPAISLAGGGIGGQATGARNSDRPFPCFRCSHGGGRHEMGFVSDPLRLRHEPGRIVFAAVCPDVHQPVQRPGPRAGIGPGGRAMASATTTGRAWTRPFIAGASNRSVGTRRRACPRSRIGVFEDGLLVAVQMVDHP